MRTLQIYNSTHYLASIQGVNFNKIYATIDATNVSKSLQDNIVVICTAATCIPTTSYPQFYCSTRKIIFLATTLTPATSTNLPNIITNKNCNAQE